MQGKRNEMRGLITEWSTDDPVVARTLQLISGETDPVAKLELEATLHQWQANDCLRRAERYREYRSRRKKKPDA